MTPIEQEKATKRLTATPPLSHDRAVIGIARESVPQMSLKLHLRYHMSQCIIGFKRPFNALHSVSLFDVWFTYQFEKYTISILPSAAGAPKKGFKWRSELPDVKIEMGRGGEGGRGSAGSE